MLKHSRWVYGTVLAAMLGGGSVVQAQQTAAEVEALFAKLDKNSDGKLAKDEVPEEQAGFFARLVRLGDKDQDGVLTKDEFQQANKPEEKPNNVPLGPGGEGSGGRGGDVRQRFEMLDRNKDGKVSLEEIPEQFRERMKPFFDRLGKTELTAEEFSRLPGPGGPPRDPKETFKQFDKDNDGKLTREELPEFLRERAGAIFERLGKTELTEEEWVRAAGRMRRDFEDRAGQSLEGRRPEGARPGEGTRRPEQPRGEEGRPPLGNPEEMFARLDANGDGKVTVDEAPERAKPIVTQALRRAGKDADGSLTKDEFLKNLPTPPRGGDGPRRPDGERGPESDRQPDDGRRPEGDRGPNARRPEGERGPEGRRPEGDRPAEGRHPDGDRRPEARGPDGPRGPILIRRLDKNNDGRVSKDELARLLDLFEELDTNRDGQLDPPELIGGPMGPPREGDGPRPFDRRPDGDRPQDRRVDGERRPDGDRGPEGRRPEGERRDPVRSRGEGDDRRPEREREQPRDGDKPRDRE